jgi:hypothetical protein
VILLHFPLIENEKFLKAEDEGSGFSSYLFGVLGGPVEYAETNAL